MDVEGEGDEAKFTFAGTAKPTVPELAPSTHGDSSAGSWAAEPPEARSTAGR